MASSDKYGSSGLHPQAVGDEHETGVTAIEYALIGALIAMAILVGLLAAGDALIDMYEYVADWVRWVVQYAFGGSPGPQPGS